VKAVARIERSEIRGRLTSLNADPGFQLRSIRDTKKGGGTPAGAFIPMIRIKRMRRALRRSALACRRSAAALAAANERRSSTPAVLPGTRLWRALSASPCPSPASSSQAGHHAGRTFAEAARERSANPRAGAVLAPLSGMPRDSDPDEQGGLIRSISGDDLSRIVAVTETAQTPVHLFQVRHNRRQTETLKVAPAPGARARA
jgi:hypothetical protein